MENNNNDEKEDLKNFKITYKLRSGEVRRFNVSKEACEPFGFYFGERIRVRGNRRAWVVGVRKGEGEVPNLYVHIDNDKGASYYSGFKREDFLKEGFELISPRVEQKVQKEMYYAPHFKALLDDKNFADVTFKIGESLITAHRNILVARSEYFRAMFTGGMRENNEKVISIPDVDERTFREVLEFLYTGKIEIGHSNMVPIITAAEKFQITDLKEVCYSTFDKVASEQNILQILLVADSYNEQTLKDLCKKYILQHYDTVVRTAEFKSLITAENSDLILEIMSELSFPRKASKKRKKSCE
eukprot:TRINITY_DN19784_c0_g1_i1.p1 TRINITY_DN19784_c0_g1~~TRINITY_DN19784_c0_g1_i1.p1  ORF type:complete len:300 (+),score=70.82 TRINITY_DN19784_c0_g1_i1:245-1144(+)